MWWVNCLHTQTYHFDLAQNLNECQKKSEYTEKNLNLTTKIELLYRNLYQNQSQKKSEFGVRLSEFHLSSEEKSEWMSGLPTPLQFLKNDFACLDLGANQLDIGYSLPPPLPTQYLTDDLDYVVIAANQLDINLSLHPRHPIFLRMILPMLL